MRLIDADVMIEYLRKQLCDNCHEQKDWCDICDYAYLIDEMKKVPTVDAVEVVRCGDCKHNSLKRVSGNAYCDLGIGFSQLYDFCSRGERKDETD